MQLGDESSVDPIFEVVSGVGDVICLLHQLQGKGSTRSGNLLLVQTKR